METARFGPIKTFLRAYTAVTYDTNINNSPTAPLSDIYTTLSLDMGIHWKATRRNEIQLNFGLSYIQYFENQQFNQNNILIAPDTGIDYRLYFSDFVLTLYDYPSINNNAGAQDPGVTNAINFSQFSNQGGLSLLWDLGQLLFLTGIERSDVTSLSESDFNSQNSTSYSLYGIVSHDLTPTTTLGLRMQVTTTDYPELILNNSLTTKTGIFYQSRLTKYTTLYAEIGLQTGTFFNTGTQSDNLNFQETDGFNTNVESTLGGNDFIQPYFQLMLTNQLNRFVSHSLSLSREATGSNVSNYQETNALSYNLQYQLNRLTTLGP